MLEAPRRCKRPISLENSIFQLPVCLCLLAYECGPLWMCGPVYICFFECFTLVLAHNEVASPLFFLAACTVIWPNRRMDLAAGDVYGREQ